MPPPQIGCFLGKPLAQSSKLPVRKVQMLRHWDDLSFFASLSYLSLGPILFPIVLHFPLGFLAEALGGLVGLFLPRNHLVFRPRAVS